jgi:hypothetical protein
MAKEWANKDKYHPFNVLEPRVQMPRAKASVRTAPAWGERKAAGGAVVWATPVRPVRHTGQTGARLDRQNFGFHGRIDARFRFGGHGSGGWLKERYGEPERRESEWEPIKILLERDGGSNKMNTASNTCLRLTTQVGQAHAATGVLLDLGTNSQPHRPENTAEHKTRASVTYTGQAGEHHRSDRSLLVKFGDFHRTALHQSGRCNTPVRPIPARKPQNTKQAYRAPN